jgi:hypothetical protein
VCAVYAAHAADVEGDFFGFFLTHIACLPLKFVRCYPLKKCFPVLKLLEVLYLLLSKLIPL